MQVEEKTRAVCLEGIGWEMRSTFKVCRTSLFYFFNTCHTLCAKDEGVKGFCRRASPGSIMP